MSEKATSESVELAPTPTNPAAGATLAGIDLSAPRKKYLFGTRGPALVRVISLAGAVGFLLFGYDQGVLGGINTSDDFLTQFNNPSNSLLGTINAIYEIGCFAGAVNVFLIGEKLGRRMCLYVGALLMTIGAILQASSFGVPQMIVGRIVCGWGNGFNTATTPLWVSELSPASKRGRLVAVGGSLIALGIVIASYYNIGMYFTSGPVVWRAPIASQIIFIIVQVALVAILPESPRWLTQHGRHFEALDVLAQLHGKDTPLDHPDVVRIKEDIDRVLALEHADGPWSIKECFVGGPLKIRRRYLLAIGVQAMQQLSGINVLVYYFPHILTADLGFSREFSLQLAAGLSVTYFVFSLTPVFFLDRMSRRKPLIIGAFGCAICFLVAGLLQRDQVEAKTKASLAFFFLYEAIFAIGWIPVPWLYPSEIMPLRHRTHSAAISAAGDWIFNYMIVQITPIMVGNIGWKSYMVFFVLNLVFSATVWLFFPETSGKTLEELDSLWFPPNDRVILVDGKGRLLPAFRGRFGKEAAEYHERLAASGVLGV
ncbi:hypothetical protein VTK73DRAFT_1207 [Phialemonium thermophilum]|uniref:Major facilitator superfamily (MFS) profile domain-containing protein n=1 Tax=Phialemonium thermophilum TaxID=223376 RepID=A0ABR3VTQ3_9PEZI